MSMQSEPVPEDAFRNYIWKLEASFQETERKMINFKASATARAKDVPAIPSQELRSVVYEMQNLVVLAINQYVSLLPALTFEKPPPLNDSFSDSPDDLVLNGGSKEIFEKNFFVDRSEYPASIQKWVTDFNEWVVCILKPLNTPIEGDG